MNIVVGNKKRASQKARGDLLEKLAERFLASQNFKIQKEVRVTGTELDLFCTQRVNTSRVVYVECKAYNDKNIDSDIIKKLTGTKDIKGYGEAWLISTSDFGKDAKGLVLEIASGPKAKEFTFFDPESLIESFIAAKIFCEYETALASVKEVVDDKNKIGTHHLLISPFGDFWVTDYLAGGEPTGRFYSHAETGDLVYEEDLLSNIQSLDTSTEDIDSSIILKILELSRSDMKKREHDNMKLSYEYIKEIKDLGIKINHPNNTSLDLDDVSIFPDLEEILKGKNKKIRSDSLIKSDVEQQNRIIFGADLSGKTTLGRLLQISSASNLGVTLFVNATDIKSSTQKSFQALLERNYIKQYGNNHAKVDLFKEMVEEHKSINLIIDNFEHVGIKRSAAKAEFLNHLNQHYKNITLFVNTTFEIELMTRKETQDPLQDYKSYRILQLGHVKRDELVGKWLGAGNYDTLSDNDALSSRSDMLNKINVAVGTNFIPTYPFYLLTMLHLFESGSKTRTQGSSYAELYNYFITQALFGAGVSPEDLDFYQTYLSFVAYKFFKQKSPRMTKSDVENNYLTYAKQMDITKKFTAVHKILISAKLLKLEDNGDYAFYLSYCNYYFVAKYLSDKIDEIEVQESIRLITQELHTTEYANIVIFLIHHSKNKSIINGIVERAKEQFKNVLPQKLTRLELEKINNLIHDEMKFAMKSGSPDTNRKEELERRDRYENSKSSHEDGDILDIFGQINFAFKTMDVLGQIANNYYGSLDATSKANIINESFELCLRGMGAFMNSFDEYVDSLRQYLEERMKEAGEESDVDAKSEIDKTIYTFTQVISYAFIKRISESVASKNLINTVDKVLDIQESPASSLVSIAVKLNFPDELAANKKKIQDVYKSMDKNYLSRDLLKVLVLQHMYKFEVSYKDKQSICDHLGIDYNQVKKDNLIA